MPATICLSMIVRNESAVIERCLNAVKPYIDAYAIVDTGSDDDTVERIQQAMGDTPGAVVKSEWKGMSRSRNEALDLAREQTCDYMLMLDADDVWTPEENFEWPADMNAPAYHVKLKMNSQSWMRPALMKCSEPWRYEGNAHEQLCGKHVVTERLPGAYIDARPDGYRRSTEGRGKYDRIAAILEKDLEEDPTNRRNMYYLAQSYRDAEKPAKALPWYQKRARAGGWEEEAWHALFQVALLMGQLEYAFEDVIAAFQAAYERRPHRPEPLVAAAFYCRQHNRKALAALFAQAAVDMPPSGDILFVDESCAWRAMDELAVSAYHIGRMDIAIEMNMRLLARTDIPDAARERIENNLEHSVREGKKALRQL